MKFKIPFIAAILFCLIAQSQEEIAAIRFKSVHKLSEKSSYTFQNEDTNELLLIFKEYYSNATAVLFDKNFKGKYILPVDFGKKRFYKNAGFNTSGAIYKLVFFSKNGKKYAVQTIDFNNATSQIKEFEFEKNEEKYVTSFQYDNKLHLLYALENNTLILKKLNNDFQFHVLKSFKINISEEDKPLLKSSLFQADLFTSRQPKITNINNKTPNLIDNTVAKNKLYQHGKSVYITIENDEELSTSLHTIDLENLTLTTKIHPYPKGKTVDLADFNSFLVEDKLLQIGGHNKELSIVAKNLNGDIIKEYYIERDLPISFKNSPIIEENKIHKHFGREEIEETKVFLKSLSTSKIGLSAYKEDEFFKVSIGGSKETAHYSSGIGLNGNIGFIGGSNNSSSIYFNTTFNEEFEYVEEELEANIFERLGPFKEELVGETGELVFSHNSINYYAYFDNKSQTYHIYKM